jgi:hypothetical protein
MVNLNLRVEEESMSEETEIAFADGLKKHENRWVVIQARRGNKGMPPRESLQSPIMDKGYTGGCNLAGLVTSNLPRSHSNVTR